MSEEDEFGDLYSDLVPASSVSLRGNALPAIRSSSPRFFEHEEKACPDELASNPSQSFFMLGLDDSNDEGEEQQQHPKLLQKTEAYSEDDSEDEKAEQAGKLKGFQPRPNKLLATTGLPSLQVDHTIFRVLQQPMEEGSGIASHVLEGLEQEEVSGTQKPQITSTSAANVVKHSGIADAATLCATQTESMAGDAIIKQSREIEVIGFNANDLESDSEDDLRIVLNDRLPVYQSSERARQHRSTDDDSEDEDGEDFVVLAGDEAVDDKDWGDESILPPTEGAQASAMDKLLAVGGEKQVAKGDEKGQTGRGVAQHQRKGYGGHSYHHQYRYIRPGAIGGAGAASGAGAPSNWVGKGGSARGDWTCRGPLSQGPWSNPASRGPMYGFEYSLPSNKTVFDIDIDSLEEKPWRHCVDVSDFFNFGFNESSWKDYCKQLVQLRLESTMHSKIRVYESGRSEQEINADLPAELVAASGIQRASIDSLHRNEQADTTCMGGACAGSGRNSGRGQISSLPTGQAIQVEGGGSERRPSIDTRKHRIRESDAILLFDSSDVCLPSGRDSNIHIMAKEKEGSKASSHFHVKDQAGVQGGAALQRKAHLTSGTEGQGKKRSCMSNGAKLAKNPEVQEEFSGKLFSVDKQSSSAARHKAPPSLSPVERILVQERGESDGDRSKISFLVKKVQTIGNTHRTLTELQESLGSHKVSRVHAKGKGTKSSNRIDRKKELPSTRLRKIKSGLQKTSLFVGQEISSTRMAHPKPASGQILGSHEAPARLHIEAEPKQRKIQPTERREDGHPYEGECQTIEQTSKHLKRQERKGAKEIKLKSTEKKKKKKRRIDPGSKIADGCGTGTKDQSRAEAKIGKSRKIRVRKEETKGMEEGNLSKRLVLEGRHEDCIQDIDASNQRMKDFDDCLSHSLGTCELLEHTHKEDTFGLKFKDNLDNVGNDYSQQQGLDVDLKPPPSKVLEGSQKSKSHRRRKGKKDPVQEMVTRQSKAFCKAELATRNGRSVLDHLHSRPRVEVANGSEENLKGRPVHAKVEEVEGETLEGYREGNEQGNCYSGLADSLVQSFNRRRLSSEHLWVSGQHCQAATGKTSNKRRRRSSKARLGELPKDAAIESERKDMLALVGECEQDELMNNNECTSYQTDSHLRKFNSRESSNGYYACLGVHKMDMDRWPENQSGADKLFTPKGNPSKLTSLLSQEEKRNGLSKLEQWTNRKVLEIDTPHDVMVYRERLTKKGRRFQMVISTSEVEQGPKINDASFQATQALDNGVRATGTVGDGAKFKGKHRAKTGRKLKGTAENEVVINNESKSDWQPPLLSKQQLELAAKLEKRRERFKMPISEERDLVVKEPAPNICQPQGIMEVKGERPVRKRRWGG